MIDYKRIEELYLLNDIDHGITLEHFKKLAEEIYQDGYGEGYDNCFVDYNIQERVGGGY